MSPAGMGSMGGMGGMGGKGSMGSGMGGGLGGGIGTPGTMGGIMQPQNGDMTQPHQSMGGGMIGFGAGMTTGSGGGGVMMRPSAAATSGLMQPQRAGAQMSGKIGAAPPASAPVASPKTSAFGGLVDFSAHK